MAFAIGAASFLWGSMRLWMTIALCSTITFLATRARLLLATTLWLTMLICSTYTIGASTSNSASTMSGCGVCSGSGFDTNHKSRYEDQSTNQLLHVSPWLSFNYISSIATSPNYWRGFWLWFLFASASCTVLWFVRSEKLWLELCWAAGSATPTIK